jgi:hypothetical protein
VMGWEVSQLAGLGMGMDDAAVSHLMAFTVKALEVGSSCHTFLSLDYKGSGLETALSLTTREFCRTPSRKVISRMFTRDGST